MDDDLLLAVHGLCYRIRARGRQILDNIDLELRRGEILTLIGPNGAGKTTLVRILLGLLKPVSGDIWRKSGLRFGYVPQRLHIERVLPLRVRDFLLLAGRFDQNRLCESLDEVGMQHLLDSQLQSISGGELQRVLLARALLRQPDVMVLDEPGQGVDILGQRALYQTIRNIRDRHNCGVLMVSHDLHLVMASTDRVICLNTHVCCTGHPEAVSEHPEYLKIFGHALDGFAVYEHHHNHVHDDYGNVVKPGNNGHG
jgi:zinc transport system ATP-binding protein